MPNDAKAILAKATEYTENNLPELAKNLLDLKNGVPMQGKLEVLVHQCSSLHSGSALALASSLVHEAALRRVVDLS